MEPAKIEALIRLLADDDPKIRQVARGHLVGASDSARPFLEGQARHCDDPQVRLACRRLLFDLARTEKLHRWNELAAGDHPDLESAAFLIAEIEFPELEISSYKQTLDDCGAALKRRLSASRSGGVLVNKLKHLLFRELGLQGNRENYYDPDNSYLPRVLDRKLGIPISLSVITMLVARRVGFELEGVGLPGHFLVRHRAGRTETYIDSFNGGKIWTREDCLHYLEGQGGGHGVREEQLRTYTTTEILIRMLANLLHIYRGREEVEKAKRVSEMIHVLVGERFTK